jgi:uncharacterized protein
LTYANSRRELLVDALRALALLGVFIVNTMGYPSAPNYPMPLGIPVPADSMPAIGLNGVLSAFVQGKAYPLLCFLFGYSLYSMAHAYGESVFQVKYLLKKRYKKLLVIGILHGLFVYFGDVLTTYAICGFVVTRWVAHRPVRLIKIFRTLTIFVAIEIVLFLLLSFILWIDTNKMDIDMAQSMSILMTYSTFLKLNASSYIFGVLNTLVLLPILLWLTVAGVLTRRFRLLSLRPGAIYFWQKNLRPWHFTIALVFNIVMGVFIVKTQSADELNKLSAIGLINMFAGIWLVASALAILVRHWHKVKYLPPWIHWLAPAGKHTLAMYLALSFALMLSGGAFLNIQVSTAVRFVAIVFAWISAVSLAKHATNLGLRDPIASWISARN